MEGDNNNDVAIPQEKEDQEHEPIAPNNNNNIAIEKEGVELLVPDSSKCPVCMEDPFCGFCPFACDHVICLKCVDPSVVPRRIECCPLCRNDAWVFPLEVKAVGSDREREVISEIAKIARVGNEMQETIRMLAQANDNEEQARYAEEQARHAEEAEKRLEALALAVVPLTERVDRMAAKIVSESTRRFAVQAGTKLLGLWLMFLLAIASQSLLLAVILLMMTGSIYIVATEYIAWAEKTHGELLAEGQILGGDLKALDKQHRPQRQESFEHLHYYRERDFGDRRNAPIGAVRRRDAGQPIAVAGRVQLVDNRNRMIFPGDHYPMARANQVVQEN